MPIKGISEVIRLPRLGKIHLGIKKDVGGTTYPEATDHFVCPEEIKKVFGEKSRELRIMFPTNDPAQWASQYLRCYSESLRLICRGDGKTAVARESAIPDSKMSRLWGLPTGYQFLSFHGQYQLRPETNFQYL